MGASMHRLVVILLAAGGLTLAPATAGAASVAKTPPHGTVTLCDRVHQSAVFEGRMDTFPRTGRMQMRFRLQISTPAAPAWTRLAVPGFSSWVTSDPGRTRYVYSKRVEALLAPAAYRVLMRFRWLDAQGATLRTAKAISKPCRQPDPRPDLRVTGLGLAPAANGSGRRYDVTVRNTGRSGAAASTLHLVLADGSTLAADVPPIAPGGREDVFLSGPACRPGDVLTATADVADAVDERDEANTFSLPCPSS
jgi:hypothetical protein